MIKDQITNENFSALIEENLRQSARSLSDERREYIASLLANSVKPKIISWHWKEKVKV